MKLFKNPFFAIVLCLLLILSSTFISSVGKLNREYRKVCGNLCDAIVDFAAKEKLGDLEQLARSKRADTTADKDDFDALIAEYNLVASDYSKNRTNAVEKAIKNYSGYFQKLQSYPARLFVRFLNEQITA